jgi:hypothetical protein
MVIKNSLRSKDDGMDIDQVGEYLESQGLDDAQIDAYFEHSGVRGMHWGVRKQKKMPTKTERKRALYDQTVKSNKSQRRVATGAAFIATNIIASGIAKKAGLNKKFTVSTVILGTAAVNSMMKVHGAQKLAELQG